MTESAEEFDFMGDSSLREIALGMDEIDNVLNEISAVDQPKETPKKEAESGEANNVEENNVLATSVDYDDSDASVVSDVALDDEEGGGGLAQLQGELRDIEAAQSKGSETAPTKGSRSRPPVIVPDDAISVTVTKPVPTAALGVSMKTLKGVTKVVGVSEKGLLFNSAITVGDRLFQVNGISFKNAKHARYIIQKAQHNVTIVFQKAEVAAF